MAAVASTMNDNGLWLPGATTKEDKIERWWEVNRKHDPPLNRGATPLIERCMRVQGWNESFAKRTLRGYRQFMELKSVMNDWEETKLSAPIAIQQMWEQHILDNLNYTDDCFLLFGRVIGHDPDAILNDRATLDRIKTTKIAFQARYGGDLDPEVWDFGHSDLEGMTLDGDDLGGTPQQMARGRLPVANIDRGASLSPRARSIVVSTDEADLTGPMTEQIRVESVRSRSPTNRTRSLSKTPKSPKSPTGNDPITIFLRDTNSGEETYFSLRYRSTLRIVFTVFAERKGLSQENLKFSFNGQSLTGYETPYSLGLEDRARIDVLIGQRRT
ncbi:predicted protein [Phaeodactylum tricornutum CCAP 1055/1]|uniref:Ubiquitin-like domain-containing protein n=2 Tax=Phaeodactylum tricornutum TaxID=2850 RepID=B7G535_PHATC|nr:predicted protein [Phaeodactylum tricornutum CCAP 1055/1]EEC46078.1 predicted protein [Phaeodactylum tricornutum CCAP 1055/1]|eukprot:XP_002182177.1 predicted protein [Phaeodactylum tricornutum CCAP 1055/1]